MTHSTGNTLEFSMLGQSDLTQAKSILVDAYRGERTFRGLFDAHRSGFEQRLRAFVREYLLQHLQEQQSLIGASVNGRLVGVALLCEPGHYGALMSSRRARFGLAMTVGLACCKRYLAYQDSLRALMPDSKWCFLPLVGVIDQCRNQGIGAALINEAHRQSGMILGSQGTALGSGAAQAAEFYSKLGFSRVGELEFQGTSESYFFRNL